MGEVNKKDIPKVFKGIIANNAATSLITGGVVSINGGDNTKFDLTAGCGYITDGFTDPQNPVIRLITWPEFLAQDHAVGFATTIAIELDQVTGVNTATGKVKIFANVTSLTPEEQRDFIGVGGAGHFTGTVIDFPVNALRINALGDTTALFELSKELGFILQGIQYSNSGANLKLAHTSGKGFQVASNLVNNPKDPNNTQVSAQDPISWVYVWRDGAGGFTIGNNPFIQDLEADAFDDNTGGLSSNNKPDGVLGNNNFTVDRIYLFTATNTQGIHFGQNEYNTFVAAKAARDIETFDESPLTTRPAGAVHVAWVIRKKGVTDLDAAILAGEAEIINVPRN